MGDNLVCGSLQKLCQSAEQLNSLVLTPLSRCPEVATPAGVLGKSYTPRTPMAPSDRRHVTIFRSQINNFDVWQRRCWRNCRSWPPPRFPGVV